MDPYDARCREDQIQECRNAVAGDSLANIESGGVCTPNKYDIYDQLCTLNLYTGGIDYCCCGHAKKALCCRFHYDHNYFRCDEEEDLISLPLSLTVKIVISVVVTLIVVVTVVTITVKCLRGRRMGKRRRDKPSQSKANTTTVPVEESQEPLNPRQRMSSRASGEGNNNDHVPFSLDTRPEPSAPPDDEHGRTLPPPYQRVESQPADMCPSASALHGPDHQLYRSESDNYEERRHLQVQPEPPPAYDEHHDHPIYQPEINNTDRAENWL